MRSAMDAEARDRRRHTHVTLLVAGALFMENLDATVITPAIPAMARSFGVAAVDLDIGVSAYMIALGVFIPISGWVAERFGARRTFGLAIGVFTIASLACAGAATLWQFAAMRVLQGIGGAMMVPVGRLVVLRDTPKDRLVHAIAMITWPALLAPVLGPPLGGWIAQYADWRWIFWLNLPLGVVALTLALRLLPDTVPQRDRRFDWIGFVLVAGAVVSLTHGSEGLTRSTGANWREAVVVAGLGASLVAIAVWHLRRARHPMFRLDVLTIPTFRFAVRGGALFAMSVSAVPFLLPLLFQVGFGYDALVAGTFLMSVFAGNLAIKPATTAILRKFGFRPTLIANGLLNAVMIASCMLFTPGTPIWLVHAVVFVGGMARSLQFTALHTIAFGDVGPDDMASASTLFSSVIQLAMGFGVALGAMAWRFGDVVTMDSADAGSSIGIAFAIVGAVSILSVLDCLLLQRGAGDRLVRRRAEGETA